MNVRTKNTTRYLTKIKNHIHDRIEKPFFGSQLKSNKMFS